MPAGLKLVVACGILAGVAFFIAAAAGIIVYNSYADELVPPDELAINEPSFGAKILDRNGNLLYEYVDDRAGLRRPVPISDISPHFLAATIATEDNNFFTNPGVNIKGLVRAAWENSPLGGSVFEGSGGSSITQQLVKNVYIPIEARQERFSSEGIDRKIKETVYAIELTQRYSKEQVLEWYVNQISYGGVYNGVEAAAQGYFGKPASELTLSEAAMLAGIPQCPSCYDPVNQPEAAAARRNEILDLMVRQGRIQIGEDTYYNADLSEVSVAKSEAISISEKRFPIEAPHWVLQYVQPRLEALPGIGRDAIFRDGLVVTTTLDLELQYEFQEIMEKHIRDFEDISNSRNGSMMYIDPKTGEILVMIGSRDYWNEDIEGKNNNATACNSPGSSFKPFAYMTAFKELGWGPGTLILDTPVTYKDALGREFAPRNPSGDFKGPVTVRNALGNSLNIPANKAAAAVGADKIVDLAKTLGFGETFRFGPGGCSRGGGYGPAIATGGVDVTLEEMMIGYSVLANGGILRGVEAILPRPRDERTIDPVAILKVVDAAGTVRYDVEQHRKQQRVIDAEYAYLVWSILTDPSAQCATFGCGGISIPGYRAGVKTGTSEPFDVGDRCYRKIGETWAFAYSPDVVVGIWAGNADNDCIEHIYSTSISFRATKDGFLAAHRGLAATAMDRPAGVVEAEVCVPSGMLPSDLCGRTTKDLFAKQSLPEEKDTWWQRINVDIRTGMIATPSTPSQFRRSTVALVPPADLLKTDEDKEAWEEWAKTLNVPLVADGAGIGIDTGPNGSTVDPEAAVAIYTPRNGQNVVDVVQIIGRASSPNFLYYTIEYGAGTNPSEWVTIVANPNRIDTGTIGAWNTFGLPAGEYTLRLTVRDATAGNVSTSVRVTIGGNTLFPNAAPTGTPPLAP
jgi:membrane peptidoglycan carboxypeptidase